MLHYNPTVGPVGLPRSPLGLCCGTLGLDKHDFVFSVIEMLLYSPLLNDKVPSHHTDSIQVLGVQPFLSENSLLPSLPHPSFSLL